VSHPEQLGFFEACVAANPDVVAGGRVLEIGSYDVNGSVRRLFASAGEYVGVDLVEGPGVDRVADGSQLDDPDGSWDVTVSGECFEHDPHWRDTLATMVRLTRPGGLVAVTCASRGRVEHGTTRTTATLSPGTQSVGLDHYRNVSVAEVEELPLTTWFSTWTLHHAPVAADLYLAAVRAGTPPEGVPSATLPSPEAVAALGRLMPASERALRLPLRVLTRVVSDEDRFQDLATRYWRGVVATVATGGRVARTLRLR
jgi:SAM-dependent methyltransferase